MLVPTPTGCIFIMSRSMDALILSHPSRTLNKEFTNKIFIEQLVFDRHDTVSKKKRNGFSCERKIAKAKFITIYRYMDSNPFLHV